MFIATAITLVFSVIVGALAAAEINDYRWLVGLAVICIYAPIHPRIGKLVVLAIRSTFDEVNKMFRLPSTSAWPSPESPADAVIVAAFWPVTCLAIPFAVIAIIFGRIFHKLF
ncbi:MAG TPA: hypothetical protein VFQ41_16055 [Candidatus Angelobacter sp.]|nr:hypothetical protein [Candidatus Angelobacter sp.]